MAGGTRHLRARNPAASGSLDEVNVRTDRTVRENAALPVAIGVCRAEIVRDLIVVHVFLADVLASARPPRELDVDRDVRIRDRMVAAESHALRLARVENDRVRQSVGAHPRTRLEVVAPYPVVHSDLLRVGIAGRSVDDERGRREPVHTDLDVVSEDVAGRGDSGPNCDREVSTSRACPVVRDGSGVRPTGTYEQRRDANRGDGRLTQDTLPESIPCDAVHDRPPRWFGPARPSWLRCSAGKSNTRATAAAPRQLAKKRGQTGLRLLAMGGEPGALLSGVSEGGCRC